MAITEIATATGFVQDQLRGLDGPLTVLGAFPTAVYLRLPAGPVIAVLSADAVRLPIGLLLALRSGQLPLARVTRARLSEGELVMTGPAMDELRVRIAGRRSATLVPVGAPLPAQLAACLRQRPAALAVSGLAEQQLAALATDPAGAVAGLIGAGPGLTPAGDDLLCGYLAGAILFGAPDPMVARRVLAELAHRPRATTDLSAQLLARAVAGDGLEQLQQLADALADPAGAASLVGPAWQRLCAIGHSSGAALALGLLTAANRLVNLATCEGC